MGIRYPANHRYHWLCLKHDIEYEDKECPGCKAERLANESFERTKISRDTRALPEGGSER